MTSAPRHASIRRARVRSALQIVAIFAILAGVILACNAAAPLLWVLSLRSGAYTEVIGRAPTSITVGPDGNLWFVERNRGVGRITPEGAITEFKYPGKNHLAAITRGPDGNLWYVSDRAGTGEPVVGRVTTQGDFLDNPVQADGDLSSITTGPDGNLWFTAQHANYIGRMTPTGVLRIFPLYSQPQALTADAYSIITGPDGNLWFTVNHFADTQQDVNGIGRMTPGGVLTFFAQPTPDDLLESITRGPDGALWFCESSEQRLVRITTQGVTLDVLVGDNPRQITSGPDGNLWYTSTQDIGRSSPQGGGTLKYSVPFFVGAITTGPDGNVWFTAEYANVIGRIAPTGDVKQFKLPLERVKQNRGF